VLIVPLFFKIIALSVFIRVHPRPINFIFIRFFCENLRPNKFFSPRNAGFIFLPGLF